MTKSIRYTKNLNRIDLFKEIEKLIINFYYLNNFLPP